MTETDKPTETDQRIVRARDAYASLVKYGEESVRRGWQCGFEFGDLHSDFTWGAVALLVGCSYATVRRYVRLTERYATAELAVDAARKLGDVYNIDLLVAFADGLPIRHGRALTGRHFSYACTNPACHGFAVVRIEVDDEGRPVDPQVPAEPEPERTAS